MLWLKQIQTMSLETKEHKQRLIDCFVNAVYLYDDKLVITFNYKEASKTVTLKEVNGSIIECSGAPTEKATPEGWLFPLVWVVYGCSRPAKYPALCRWVFYGLCKPPLPIPSQKTGLGINHGSESSLPPLWGGFFTIASSTGMLYTIIKRSTDCYIEVRKMKKYITEIHITAIQLSLFYVLPLFARPIGAFGMVFLLILSTLILSFVLGMMSKNKIKFFYPIAIAIVFIPSIWIYYNESALIHCVWYFVISLIGMSIGSLLHN